MYVRISEQPQASKRIPYVLVHGLLVSSLYMLPTGRLLAADRAVYIPDLPGFGWSGHPAEVLDIRELGSALLHALDELAIPRAILLGNSLGCQVVAEVAARAPDRVAAAILTGPTMDRVARTPLAEAGRLTLDIPLERPTMFACQLLGFLQGGAIEFLRTLHYALIDRIEEKLPAMPMPTLIVRGSQDPIVPQRWVEELVGLLPDGRLSVVPGAPHALNYSRAPALVDLSIHFVRQVLGE